VYGPPVGVGTVEVLVVAVVVEVVVETVLTAVVVIVEELVDEIGPLIWYILSLEPPKMKSALRNEARG